MKYEYVCYDYALDEIFILNFGGELIWGRFPGKATAIILGEL